MKILIVEDEAIAKQRLRRLLLILEPENKRFDSRTKTKSIPPSLAWKKPISICFSSI
ncbi:MAG: hypothetical protein ACE5I1_27125 [bacterium]